MRRSRGNMERPSWLPQRETSIASVAAATALNPRPPLSTFSSPAKREVALEMVPVAAPDVPCREPIYDPVPPPRPLKPEEDKPVKNTGGKACGIPPPPPMPSKEILDSTLFCFFLRLCFLFFFFLSGVVARNEWCLNDRI